MFLKQIAEISYIPYPIILSKDINLRYIFTHLFYKAVKIRFCYANFAVCYDFVVQKYAIYI